MQEPFSVWYTSGDMGSSKELGKNMQRLFERAMPKDIRDDLGVIGIGVDSVSVADVETLNETSLEDLFTESERSYCTHGMSRRISAQRFAARFAAKEAVAKALGGTDAWNFQEVSIERTERGVPVVQLSGNARGRADALGVEFIHVSLEHKPDHGLAVCVVIGRGETKNTIDTNQSS